MDALLYVPVTTIEDGISTLHAVGYASRDAAVTALLGFLARDRAPINSSDDDEVADLTRSLAEAKRTLAHEDVYEDDQIEYAILTVSVPTA